MKTTTITLLLLGYYCICCAQQIQYQAITSNFDRPVDIATEHLTSYFYIVEQDGEIELTDVSGNIISAGFLDIKTQVIGPDDNYPGYDGELGLLGMAFHPNFNLTNAPYFYVNYTVANDNFDLETIISRFTVSSTPNQNYLSCDANSEYIVMRIPQPRSNHNAGDLVFGPDGYLYIGTGDSGGSDDPDNQAQNLSSLLGKILRIDINGDDYPMRSDFNYSIPNANPFANNNMGLAEIYAYGLRNPWRFSFDNNTGDLWIADVGQNAWEEINFIVYQENTIQNFGWSCFEGLEFNYSSTQSNCPFSTNTTLPIFAYPHNMQTGGFSVTGGFVYRGCQYPALYGQYIFADYVSGNTWLTDVTSLNSYLANLVKLSKLQILPIPY